MSTGSTVAHPQHSPLAHHFRDLDHQFDAAKMGIWLFIVSEIMMFGGLFVAYIIFHGLYPAMFAEGAKFCDWRYGAINTADLIISSFAMACAVHFVQTNRPKRAIACMSVTVVLGLVFLVIHGIEYHDVWKLGLLPSHFFHYKGPHYKNLAMFFALYFLMTGLHGLHVTVGVGVITWIMIRTKRGEFNSEYYTPVELAGLYWHFVDIIWIFLFPLLYLVG